MNLGQRVLGVQDVKARDGLDLVDVSEGAGGERAQCAVLRDQQGGASEISEVELLEGGHCKQ